MTTPLNADAEHFEKQLDVVVNGIRFCLDNMSMPDEPRAYLEKLASSKDIDRADD
jgi:hypothetical protein